MRLAGKNIEVECKNRREYAKCKPYLCAFETPDIVVRASQEEIKARQAKSEIMIGRPITDVDEIDGIESQIIYEKIVEQLIRYDIFLMHGSVVALDDNAYMFTAPSGTGKTTRTQLWLQEYPSSIIVNGDKPLIRIAENEVLACGTPWCGKEGWNTNVMIPLRAVFLLERVSDSEQSAIEEISFKSALPILLGQTYCPAGLNKVSTLIRLLKSLDTKVRFFRFRSAPTAESIRLAYETACLSDRNA